MAVSFRHRSLFWCVGWLPWQIVAGRHVIEVTEPGDEHARYKPGRAYITGAPRWMCRFLLWWEHPVQPSEREP